LSLLKYELRYIVFYINDLEAKSLCQNRSNAKAVLLDATDHRQLLNIIKSHDIVVSFLPAIMHVSVAEICLLYKRNLVTASYISPAMKELDEKAKIAGLTFLNEIGLDPGIDHLTACQIFDEVKSKGGKVTSFVSWCGGLPAPEYSNH
jgi:alpha-aminoadipic semialdehyde synthase